MQTLDDVRAAAAGDRPAPSSVDLHLIGAGVGELELLERALLGIDGELEVHAHADVVGVVKALAAPNGRATLVVVDAADRQVTALTDLRTLRASAGGEAVPVLVIEEGEDVEVVMDLYRAGASAVVRRSRFVDLWLRSLRDIVRFWAGIAALPSGRAHTLRVAPS